MTSIALIVAIPRDASAVVRDGAGRCRIASWSSGHLDNRDDTRSIVPLGA